MQKISGESCATYLASVAAGAQKHTQHTIGRAEEAESLPGRSVLYPCLVGSINDSQGVYFGHYVSTGCVNFVNLKAGTENRNVIVLGEVGEGMSVLLEPIV
ncbi:MAG: hypothetical protein A4E56_00432 [Pelotomaculum sp. PtaU1.Bin065]|nr:MAG: hypothetical protein A4E56_00432 [Pelotomaculum sp. PtaU1.Bin065]